jgi:hypothetical protein
VIPEHSTVVLLRDLPDQGLRSGDVGVIIHVHLAAGSGKVDGYMLELFAADGHSVDEVSVPADAIRLALPTDRVRVRTAAE